MMRPLLILALAAALVAVPVRADNGLLYLGGPSEDVLADSGAMRDRLKQFLDHTAPPVAAENTMLAPTPRTIPLSIDDAMPSPQDIVSSAVQSTHYPLPVPVSTADIAELKDSPDLKLDLSEGQASVDAVQIAQANDIGRSVVFDDRDDALSAMGLSPTSEGTTDEVPAQPAAADPIADEPLVEPIAVPQPAPKAERADTQLAALTPSPAQTVSIETRGEPLVLQTGKGRMLRLPEAVESIFVAEPDIADVQIKSPRMVYLFGKRPGETTVYAVTRDETVVLNRRVQVAHNLDPLNELITAIHPEALVDIQSLNNTIVLTGLVPDVSAAEDIYQLAVQVLGEGGRIMNRIKVAGVNQVNLRVRVAEVDRRISKELGFNWDVLRQTGSLAIGFATFGSGTVTSAASNVVTGSLSSGNFNVNAVIDALDNEGLITVLAEPNLTAMNGEVANFLAGGEFPIPIAQDDNTISITFKQFGVSLSFSPQTLDGGRINVKVITEVSQLSDAGAIQISGFSVPALTTRRAETTVELRSGQSFAIAGLLQNVTNQSVEEFPGLADLPILGPLFKSERFQRDETELMVVVTPYLVRPTNGQIALPQDGFVAPTDTERFLRQTNRPRVPDTHAAPRDRAGRPGSVGGAGFIVR